MHKEDSIKTLEELENGMFCSRHIDKLNKEIVDEFIDKVWIGKVDPETNTRDIDIELNIIKLV